MPRKLCLVSIVIVIATALAGCGGSSNGSSSASPPTGRQKLVAQADPLCKLITAQRAAANAEVSKARASTAKTLAALARFAPAVGEVEHHVIVRLHTLKAPASLASDWQTLLAGMEQLARDATQIGEHAKAHDYKAIVTLTSSGRKVRKQLTSIATRDGFTYCGRTS
ncbi:MAG TPA: hypothetical protein VIH71_07250 [Solirubrobacteraceae bacterium]